MGAGLSSMWTNEYGPSAFDKFAYWKQNVRNLASETTGSRTKDVSNVRWLNTTNFLDDEIETTVKFANPVDSERSGLGRITGNFSTGVPIE